MTEAERLAQRVEVVVKPHNNYGGAPAGTRLAVTRAEFQANTRCLEEVGPPPAPTPRTAVVTVRADVAKMMGFPMGRRQDGPLVYEVTRLRPDGKEPLPTRQELELRATPAAAAAEVEALAATFGWEEDEDGDAGAWLKENVPRIQRAFKEAEERGAQQVRLRVLDLPEVRERLAALRAEVDTVRGECARAAAQQVSAEMLKARELLAEELEKARAQAAEQLAAKDAELATLRAELEAAKAAPAPKGKAAKAE